LSEPVAGQPAVFQLSVTDRHGAPITGATVSGRFLRPADSRIDQEFTMVEREIGIYQATVALPEPGTWDLVLVVRRGTDSHEMRASTSVGSADQG
jgi:nitrogen fixation protein FixH